VGIGWWYYWVGGDCIREMTIHTHAHKTQKKERKKKKSKRKTADFIRKAYTLSLLHFLFFANTTKRT
jgi:hypothetical protein